MRNSTYWSLFCLAMAVSCMSMGRDIGANVFLGALFVIQGLTPAEDGRQAHRIRLILTGLSAAILLALLGDFTRIPPKGW